MLFQSGGKYVDKMITQYNTWNSSLKYIINKIDRWVMRNDRISRNCEE